MKKNTCTICKIEFYSERERIYCVECQVDTIGIHKRDYGKKRKEAKSERKPRRVV